MSIECETTMFKKRVQYCLNEDFIHDLSTDRAIKSTFDFLLDLDRVVAGSLCGFVFVILGRLREKS